MAVDFFFQPPTFAVPTLEKLRRDWQTVPNPDVRNAIAVEHQYLHFHEFMLDRCRFTAEGALANRPWDHPISLSVRAGAIKAKLLLSASIVEAALRAHGEYRGYTFNAKPTRRTFGVVLGAWSGQPEVATYWPDLRELQDLRNNIHLFRAAGEANAAHEVVVAREEAHVARAAALVAFCQGLTSL